MKNNQKRNAIIWFSKEGYTFYVEDLIGLLTFTFTPDSVRYSDVFDGNKFETQLDSFLTQNKLDNLNAYFVVDQNAVIENYFVKNNEKVLSDFLENIPYEDVISKISEKGDSMHALGFNGAFYHLLNSIVDKHKGTIEAVFPYILMPETKLTVANGAAMLKKAFSIKGDSMTAKYTALQENNGASPPNKQGAPKEKSTLPYLIPIFVILIGILVYLVVTTYQ